VGISDVGQCFERFMSVTGIVGGLIVCVFASVYRGLGVCSAMIPLITPTVLRVSTNRGLVAFANFEVRNHDSSAEPRKRTLPRSYPSQRRAALPPSPKTIVACSTLLGEDLVFLPRISLGLKCEASLEGGFAFGNLSWVAVAGDRTQTPLRTCFAIPVRRSCEVVEFTSYGSARV